MSFEAISWAIKQDIPRSSEKFCLLMLANYAGYDGFSYPSVERLAAELSQDRKTVIKSLQSLEKMGIISDSGRRVGATKSVVVYELVGLPTDEKHNYLYKLTNPETGEYYIGIRSSKVHPQADPYMGSGAWPKECLEKNVFLVKEILEIFETYEEARAAENKFFRSMIFDDGLCRNSQTIYHARKRAYQTNSTFRQKVDSGKAPPTELSNPVFPLKQYQKRYSEPIREPISNSDTTYRAEPITETSNQEPPDADSVFWAEATALAVAAGIPKKTSGALIGKALKLSGGDRSLILEKLESAAEKGADDPVSWLMSGLGGRKKSARNDKMAKINEAFAKLEEENARIKAEWAANGVFDDPIGGGEGDIQVLQPDASVGSVGIHDEGRKGVRKIPTRRPQKVIRPIGGGIVKSAIRADDSGTGWGSGEDFKKGEQEFCLNKFEQSSGMKQRMITSTRSSKSLTANEFEF